MKARDVADLVALGAIWGGSFMFQRLAAPQFGPIPLVALRVSIAAVFLTAILASRGGLGAFRGRAAHFGVVGVLNTGLPFCLFAYATLSLTAGFASVLNATVPLFGALVGYVWLRQTLSLERAIGLTVGFLGVVLLVWRKLSFHGEGLAVFAGLAAALLYGIAAHYTKRHVSGVDPLAVAAGSQIGAAAFVVPAALLSWPATNPGFGAWLSIAALGFVCTGLAYLLYFRLLASVGPVRAMAVTYLIPAFGMVWGALFLGERVTAPMLIGTAAIFAGVAIGTRPNKAVDEKAIAAAPREALSPLK